MAESEKLRRVVPALVAAAPWTVLAHWGEDYSHCIEVSHAGAIVLHKHGIEAHVVPCAVIAQTIDHSVHLVVGHNPRSLYDYYSKRQDLGPFEKWARTWRAIASKKDPYPIHVVLEAQHQGDRALIDLTSGQLGQAIEMPPAAFYFGSGGPLFESEGARVGYMACPYPEQVDPAYLSPLSSNIEGLGDLMSDLDYLTEKALLAPNLKTFHEQALQSFQAGVEVQR